MGYVPTAARHPARTPDPSDPRFLDLFGPADPDAVLAGVPFDGAVIGRRGCRDGPTAIREAFRYLATHDEATGADLSRLRLRDLGDIETPADDVLEAHRQVRQHARMAFQGPPRPAILLGGDNSLTFPHVEALHAAYGGRIGILVLDAHYDLRPVPASGIPTSGTPFRRILEDMPGKPVAAANLVEVGIRPFANTTALANVAKEKGVRAYPVAEVRRRGADAVAREALASACKGVDHLWLSVDIDGLDQSIASGCSAPGAGGLSFDEAAHLVSEAAKLPICRGMDLLEVAPGLDPTGNTARTAAQIVAAFCGGVSLRTR